MSTLDDVVVFDLKKYCDDRGFFCELWKEDALNKMLPSSLSNFKAKQVSLTTTYPNVVKAFHWHKHQTDVWFAVSGNIKVVLYDDFAKTSTYKKTRSYCIGENNPQGIVIPKYIAHGYKVLGNVPASVVYITNQQYDPKDPDEYRLSWDHIGKDIWETQNR